MAATNALNYIDAIPDKKIRRLARKVRTIIKKLIPEAYESSKRGMPCYTIEKSMVASIVDYRNHVNLYFFQGAGLSSVLLEGTGKGMRHIRIEEASSLVPVDFARLLKEAVANAKKGLAYSVSSKDDCISVFNSS